MGILTIRQAVIEDAGLIADMSRQTFFETFAEQNSKENMEKFMRETFNRDALIREVGAPGNTFLLAFQDEEPVGYVRMRESGNPPGIDYAKTIEIARIYATLNSIGKGVGKALMKTCVALAVKNNYQFIWLGVWENNQRAIDFYLKGGFKKFGTHTFMLGDDPQTDWLMKKQL
ncbi:MAG: GNAT family N-acetyltransferase [Chitinophagaceae bacterium]